MQITDEMLQRAVSKAVEIGLLPKYGSMEDTVKHWDQIRAILETTLSCG